MLTCMHVRANMHSHVYSSNIITLLKLYTKHYIIYRLTKELNRQGLYYLIAAVNTSLVHSCNMIPSLTYYTAIMLSILFLLQD